MTACILLTGGAGYPGSILCEHLLDAGCRVTVTEDFPLEQDLFPSWVRRGLHGYCNGGWSLDMGVPEAHAAADPSFSERGRK
jgi:nucleoside-diphosphate-sugar epimerase